MTHQNFKGSKKKYKKRSQVQSNKTKHLPLRSTKSLDREHHEEAMQQIKPKQADQPSKTSNQKTNKNALQQANKLKKCHQKKKMNP